MNTEKAHILALKEAYFMTKQIIEKAMLLNYGNIS